MSDWQRIKFEDLLVGKKISYGVVQPGEFQTVGGVPLIRVNNIKGSTIDVADLVHIHPEVESKYSKTRLNGGELLIVVVGSGSVGTCIIAPDSLKGFNVARAISVAKLVESVDKHFIAYQFQTEDIKYQLYGNTNDTAQPTLNLSELKQIQFVLPSLPEQKAIASVLSSLDDKIDLLHRQNKTLEAMAETLFRQWFIEEAKEDWEEITFSKWISETKGGDWGKEFPQDDFTFEVQCIRGTDIADLQIGLPKSTPNRYIKPKKFESIKPDEGDIVLEISGGTETQSTGRSYYIDAQVRKLFSKPLVFSNFCRLLRVRSPKFSKFVYLYLQYLYKSDEFFALENGSSGIKNLNYKVLLDEQTYKMPPTDLVEIFDNEVASFFSKINSNKKQIQTLERLRDTLLPKLMSGEVRVQYQTEEVA